MTRNRTSVAVLAVLVALTASLVGVMAVPERLDRGLDDVGRGQKIGLANAEVDDVAALGLELGGGFGIFKKNELERLFRDTRLGRIHPANSSLSRELVAKATLGIDFDASPRWG